LLSLLQVDHSEASPLLRLILIGKGILGRHASWLIDEVAAGGKPGRLGHQRLHHPRLGLLLLLLHLHVIVRHELLSEVTAVGWETYVINQLSSAINHTLSLNLIDLSLNQQIHHVSQTKLTSWLWS